jgi:hypothetical protein
MEEEICYQSHVFCHHFHDPVGVYMELYFSNVLEPVNFVVAATVRGDIGDVFKPLSYSSYLLSIIGIIKTHVSKLLECHLVEVFLHLAHCKSQLA